MFFRIIVMLLLFYSQSLALSGALKMTTFSAFPCFQLQISPENKRGDPFTPKMKLRTFRTEISVQESKEKVDYTQKISLIGSCFSENIGKRLKKMKFQVDINPFGIIFNPISIQRCIDKCIQSPPTPYGPQDLLYNDALEIWYSWDHHSSFSHSTQEFTLQNINHRMSSARTHLLNSNWLIITLGSAWAYEVKEEGEMTQDASRIVANCHKIPQKFFHKRLLGVEEIVSKLGSSLEQLHQINPDIKTVFTISPVRHWKDGPLENMRSKAHLVTAVHQLCEKLGSSCRIGYFPAYELMMDDLRDYRFYEEGMLHPSPLAVNYIWEKFSSCYFKDETINVMDKVVRIHQAMDHKPFQPEGQAHQKFVQSQLKILDQMIQQHPSLDFTIEKSYFLSCLNSPNDML